MDLHPYLFCLSFYLLYFVLPPFEDNGLLFWVPDVFCQHPEVVLWNLPALKCYFDEFVGEKIVSPSYSSTILGPPQSLFYYTKLKFSCSSSVKIFTWSCYPTPGHITTENNNSKRYTPVFIAALSTIVKTWRQPICPLTDKKCGIFIECNNAQP